MLEDQSHNNDLSQTVLAQGAQINAFNNRLGRLEHEFVDFAKETGTSLKDIQGAIAQLSAKEPTGLMEIIKGAIVLGVFLTTLIGGISYVVHAIGEPRVVLLEYKLGVAMKELEAQRSTYWRKKNRID